MLRCIVQATLAVALLLPSVSFSQNLYGTLTGNVTDASNAPVPACKVEARNLDNAVVRNVLTDDRGVYSFNDLQPGTYQITVQSPAFAVFTRPGVAVEAGNVRRLDARLQLGQVVETVTVDAAAVVLQADRADVNAQINKEEVTDLPIDGGRNFQS
jgi:hypothetical protein